MGCPIRKSWDHRSLAAPPSLSQLATSFIACSAKVSTCVLLCTFISKTQRICAYAEWRKHSTRNCTHPLRVGRFSCLAHESSSLCSFQGSRSRLASRSPRRHPLRIRTRSVRAGTLKAEQYSLMNGRASLTGMTAGHVFRDPHGEGRATDV